MSAETRAHVIRRLESIAERYPNLRLGQILINATSGHALYYVEDHKLLALLNDLWVTYTQFVAAGIRKEQLK
jgi:hypothetical protein